MARQIDSGRESWQTGGVLRLTINGEAREIPAALTLTALLEHLGLTDGPVAIERNREVVPRAEHSHVSVQAGDVLEIVQFVGGG